VTTLRRWISPVLTAAVLAVVVWRLGTGPFVSGLEAVDGRALAAAAGIGFVTTVCGAWRWAIVARGIGLRLSLPAAVAAYYRALFLNLTLPAGIAGDVHRGIRHGRDAHDVGRGLRAVVWERAAGQVVQLVLTIAVLSVLPSPVRPSMPYVASAVVAAAVVLVLVGRRFPTIVAEIRKGVLRRHALPAIVLTTTVAVVGYAAMFLVAARTAGVGAPLVRLVPLALIALLAMVLPSVAGWGPREGATAWVFSAAGLGANAGAAAAVAYGVLMLFAFLPGAVVLLVGRLPHRRARTSRPRGRAVFGAEGATDA
jgi:glycosyltransferase 2 family protein